MNTKRTYPLFVIDSNRTHGRGQETDYISCTSNELPFVASVTLHERKEYIELYNPQDCTTVWSDERNGIRMRVKVVSSLPHDCDKSILVSLLRRALKEMQLRQKSQVADISNITDENVIQWCVVLRSQVSENLRKCPDDKIQKMNLAILSKIVDDYEKRKTDEFICSTLNNLNL